MTDELQTVNFDPSAHGWKTKQSAGFFQLVGPIWAKRDGEGWTYGFLAQEHHVNMQGAIHGGMLMSFADHAMGVTAWEAVNRRKCVTMQLDTQFLAAAQTGDFITCKSEVVRLARSVVFMRGVLSTRDKPILAATGIWKILATD